MNRLTATFQRLQAENRAGLVPFMTSGDPDYATSLELLKGLPAAGADIIELGMVFTDPMADGPVIQRANLRALAAGQTLRKTLDMVEAFRAGDPATPIVLMGYYNPIYVMGVDGFLARAKAAGVDGLILVDLPAEEDRELCLPAAKAGLDFIRLVTPTTDAHRLQTVMKNTQGFVYYVSITGITGAGSASEQAIAAAVTRLRAATRLPVAVGFGIRSPEAAAAVARIADAVVVGSALVQRLADGLSDGKATAETIPLTLSFVRELAEAVRRAREETTPCPL